MNDVSHVAPRADAGLAPRVDVKAASEHAEELIAMPQEPRPPNGGRPHDRPGAIQLGPAREPLGDRLALAVDGVWGVVFIVGRLVARPADELRRRNDRPLDRGRGGDGVEHVLRPLGVLPVVFQRGLSVAVRARGEVDDVAWGKCRKSLLQRLAIQHVAGPPVFAVVGTQRRRRVQIQASDPFPRRFSTRFVPMNPDPPVTR